VTTDGLEGADGIERWKTHEDDIHKIIVDH
jgi:hypothetical protein